MAPKPRRIAIGIEAIWPYKHHTGIISGILAYGQARGWTCEQAPFLESAGPMGFHARAYDGVIARISPALARVVRARRLPAVNVLAAYPARGIPGVYPDHAAAGRMAARHLLELGHTRLAYLGVRGTEVARRQLAGFREAAGGAPVHERLVTWTDFPDGRTWRRFLRDQEGWIRTWKPPLGILVTNDLIARNLANVCQSAGLRVPEDAALVGVGNTELLCDRLVPSLSSIEMGFERVGTEAARLLDRLMAGRPAPREPVWVPPALLVARQSTRAFMVGDPLVSRALRLIATRAVRPCRVRDIVNALSVTRRSLERRFRRVLRRSIHDEILRVRLDRVRRLLIETDRPLKAIASETGFRCPERLAEAFRRTTGESPSEFRRSRTCR
jgi:LacI family transcriptional regulator